MKKGKTNNRKPPKFNFSKFLKNFGTKKQAAKELSEELGCSTAKAEALIYGCYKSSLSISEAERIEAIING